VRAALNARSAAALGCAAVALAAGAAVARICLWRAPAAIAGDLAQPLAVVTAWGPFGATLFAVLAAASAASVLLLAAAARPALQALKAPAAGSVLAPVLAASALGLGACLLWPVVFSSDVYAYAAYGDLALRGLDPYLLAPPGFHDAFADAARRQWGGAFPVCAYGTGFVWLAARIVAAFGPFGVAATLWAFRLAACGGFLAGVALLHDALRDLTARQRLVATGAYALNPVALWSAAEGHNDALLMCCVLAAAALAARGRTAAAGVLAGLTPLLKAPGLALGAVLAIDASSAAFGPRKRFVAALLAGLAASIVLAGPAAQRALGQLAGHALPAPQASLAVLIGRPSAAIAGAALAYAGARRLAAGIRAGYALLGIGLWLAVPNPYPWYALWVLPAAAVALPAPAARALWGVTIFALVRYLPDATGNMTLGAPLALVALAPLGLAFLPLPHRSTSSKKAAAAP
jgi:hypothetical protein